MTKIELERALRLLAAVLDGVDGYESETGNLRYWNEKAVKDARALLDEVSKQSSKKAR